MNTFTVRCVGETPKDTDKVIITLASGRTLAICATDDPSLLRCVVRSGEDMLVVYPRGAYCLWIELR